MFTFAQRVDLVRIILPSVDPEKLARRLGVTLLLHRPDKYPAVRQIVALLVRQGANLSGTKAKNLGDFDGRYVEIWWAILVRGEPLWATAPDVTEYNRQVQTRALRNRRTRLRPMVSVAPFPTTAYRSARVGIRAALGVAVGKNLAGFLWAAL